MITISIESLIGLMVASMAFAVFGMYMMKS